MQCGIAKIDDFELLAGALEFAHRDCGGAMRLVRILGTGANRRGWFECAVCALALVVSVKGQVVLEILQQGLATGPL